MILVAALAVAGCGGKSKTTNHSTASTTTSSNTATTAPPGDCNTLGINPTGMREGTCTHAGITYVIVDENHTLKLHSLSASLSGIRTTSSLSGQAPGGQDKFVVLTITITDRLELPQMLDASGTQQAGLILEGTVYKEDVSAERSSGSGSCLSRGYRIPSGKSETCDVIFAVPAGSAADLGQHGSGDLYLVDFGSDLAGSVPPQTVGQIRLYH